MSIVTVRIENDDPAPLRVQNVVVSFYDDEATFQTSGTTNVLGEVAVDLPNGIYSLFFYKQGLSILPRQPQQVVVEGPDPATFLVIGHERKLPESTDPRRCKVSGYIFGVGGQKMRSRLIFSPVKDLIILDDNITDLVSSLEIESDGKGYFEFELLRGQSYYAYFLWLESFLEIPPPARVKIIVPQLPGAELSKLFFPIPVAAEFSALEKTLSMSNERDTSLFVDIVWSDGSSRWDSYAWAGVQTVNSDDLVVDFSVSAGTVVLMPRSPGVAILSISRVMSGRVVFDPLDVFTSEILTVTVVP